MTPLPPPTFATWTHENLVAFATEANEVIKRQRELIQLYRAAMVKDEENDSARKDD